MDPDNSPVDTHASYLIKYDPGKKIDGKTGFYEGINSWGIEWGFKGHYFADEDFIRYKVYRGYTVQFEAKPIRTEVVLCGRILR